MGDNYSEKSRLTHLNFVYDRKKDISVSYPDEFQKHSKEKLFPCPKRTFSRTWTINLLPTI